MKDKFLKSIQRKSWLLLALFFISSCSNEDIVKHPVITIAKRKKGNYKKGFYFGLCITLIFTFRFFIEFLKERQVDFENTLPIDMGQILSIPFMLLGISILLTRYSNKTPLHEY